MKTYQIFALAATFQALFGLISASCGGNFTNQFNGTFTSPGYPSNYEFGLECTWTITVAAASKINLEISDVDILSTGGGDVGCGENQVSVTNPNSLSPVESFCSQSKPQGPITSEGDQLVVKFVSTKNETGRSKGFSATFTTILPPTTTTTVTTTSTTTANTTTTTEAANTTVTTTATTTNSTTPKSTNAPVTQPPKSGLSSGGIAAICIVVILCVLLLIDLILYQKEMGVIFTIKKSCCGGYAAVST